MARCALVSLVLLLTVSTLTVAAPLADKDVKLDGLKITILPAQETITIDPLPVEKKEQDGQLQMVPQKWNAGFRPDPTHGVYKGMNADSLVLTLVEKPDEKLIEGKDYLLNKPWGAITGLATGRYSEGTKVHAAFNYTMSRLDLVEQAADGKITVKKGLEDLQAPHLPDLTPGSKPLLSVYMSHNTTALTMDKINLIDPSYDGVPPVTNVAAIKEVKDKLAAGKPVSIVFFGDSITNQGPKDFRDGQGNFIDRFTKYLENKYPDRKVIVTPKETVVKPKDKEIAIVKAGVGGNTTVEALARIDRDVLAHKADLVVVMFGVNDENRDGAKGNGVPVADYKKNLALIVKKIRIKEGEPILMTTSMKNLGWDACVGNLNEYAAAARAVAKDKNVCLVDNFQAWQDLPKRGYNYLIFLDTCLNHPNDLGHDLFIRGLKSAFEAK
jgi:lysophospholipase L1-like esterase